MRITILALGSPGDVQPFISLGKTLLEAGHRVRIATFEALAGMVREAGLDFSPIHGDAQGWLETEVDSNLLTKCTNPFQTMQRHAAELGQKLSAENGVQCAVKII
jgi:UDP:flavonoid glycosyltransferase YjiC (YdhE family)